MIGAGEVLAGRYRLEQRIATGGMGDVWRGFDRVLGRTVAVKCLLDTPPDEPGFVDRFWAEARTMATVSHPGVVEVYDFGDDPTAGVYLVMKYIEGESLAQRLARDGRLSIAATMRLVAEAAEALHAAHEKGVVHRDVKPGNLLLRPDGSAVLTDFGIARSADGTGASTGSLLGTAGYIAPERANGQPATARSDIYALGVVAYRCLAGRMPFEGDSLVEIALRHVHDEPPPLPADVPPSIRAMVARAMAKDPADRWPTGAALAAAARRTVAPAPTQRQTTVRIPAGGPPVARRRGGRALLVAGAAALVLAAIATVVVLLGQNADSHTPDPATVQGAEVIGTSAPGPTTAPASAAETATETANANPPAGAGAGLPAAPSSLTATPIGPHTISLQWTDNSSNEDGFTIQNGITSVNVAADTTRYDWDGVAPAAYMCFKVRSYNGTGASAYYPAADLDWVCATSLNGSGPAAPTSLSATPAGPNTIHLQWTADATGVDGFTITNGVTSRNVGANTTMYDWGGLAPNTYMCFKVRSYNASGVSAYYPTDQLVWACTTTSAG